MKHDWIPSNLGHGIMICRKCKITLLEAEALGLLEKCDVEDK